MLAAIFLVGSLWFWLAIATTLVVLLALIEFEKPFWATATVLAFVALMVGWSDFNPLAWVTHNAVLFLECLAAYLVLGVVWAIVKWWFFLMNSRDRYEEIRAAFLKEKGWEAFDTDEKKRKFQDKVFWDRKTFPPKPGENKSKIVLWMTYWPCSALWTLINDPLKRFYRFAYARILGLLQGMSDRTFAKYQDELS